MEDTNHDKGRAHKSGFNPHDVYGIAKQEMEVDSNVNEDFHRERLLDDSLEVFMDTMKLNRKKTWIGNHRNILLLLHLTSFFIYQNKELSNVIP